jgi:hypothetical protein
MLRTLSADEPAPGATRRQRLRVGWRRFRQPGVEGRLTSLRAEVGSELERDERDAFAGLWRRAPIAMSQLDLAWLRAQRLLDERDRELCRAMATTALREAVDIVASAPRRREVIGDEDSSVQQAAQPATVSPEHVRPLEWSSLARAADRGDVPTDGDERTPGEQSLAADAAYLTALAQRAEITATFVERRASESAARRYARGLLTGVLSSIVLLALVGVVAAAVIRAFTGLSTGTGRSLDNAEYWALRDALVCIGGGAAGAVVSALLRLRGVTHLNYETMTMRAAFFRIVLGWFFAAALLFLIKGGLVDIFKDPTSELVAQGSGDAAPAGVNTTTSWFFWGAVGFLAGFNERWIPDLVTRDAVPADAPSASPSSQQTNASP